MRWVLRSLAEKGDLSIIKDLNELSRLKYGRFREEVENEIYKRLRK